MKKNIFVVILLTLTISVIIGNVIYKNTFQLSSTIEQEYISLIDCDQSTKYSDNSIHLGPINDAKSAVAEAEKIWNARYGKRTIRNEKPFRVSYDNENRVWYVRGTLKGSNLASFLGISKKGGTAYFIVKKDSGEVLAIGHE